MNNNHTPKSGDSSVSRRQFIERLFTASVATLAVPSVILAQASPELTLSKTGFSGVYSIDLNDAIPLQEIGGAVDFVLSEISISFRIIVTRISENEFIAVSARCPHRGFRVIPLVPGILECTAHDSRFQPDGTYISGPANGNNLKRYPTAFDGDATVTVEIDELASVAEGEAESSGIKIHSAGPLSGQIVFEVALQTSAHLTLTIWSLDGREAIRIFEGYKEAGAHYIPGDLSSIESGLYLYRLTTPDQVIGSGKLTHTL